MKRGAGTQKYWDVMMRRTHAKTPPFVEAVVKDAKLLSSVQTGQRRFRNRREALFTVLRFMWTTDAFLAQTCYRAQARLDAIGVPVLPRLMHRLAIMTGQVCIGRAVIVHPGVTIPHGQVVIDGFVEIHPGVAVLSSVTIGIRQGDFRGPTLMRDVQVGTGAKVLGNITIGAGAILGANAVVLEDVPAGATAVGVPARVIEQSQ